MKPQDALRPLLLAALAAFGVFLAAVYMKTPRLDRDWVEHLARAPEVELAGDVVRINEVRDWRYDGQGPVSRAYRNAVANARDLRKIWFVLQPFAGNDLFGHTFLVFEFEGGEAIGLTIEARREVGEPYSILPGALNAFELIYVWGSAKDLMTRRAVYLNHDLYAFPLSLPEETARTFFLDLAATSKAVAERARFYNTFTSNCTNELAQVANAPWSLGHLLTGLAPRDLFDRGAIASADSYENAKRMALVTEDVIRLNTLASRDFDRALLGVLASR